MWPTEPNSNLPSFHLPHVPLLLPTVFPLPPLSSWICRFWSTCLSTNGILATCFLGVHAAVRKSQLSWWFKGDFSASEKPWHSCILHHYKSSLLLTPNKETPPFNVPIFFYYLFTCLSVEGRISLCLAVCFHKVFFIWTTGLGQRAIIKYRWCYLLAGWEDFSLHF